MEDQTNFLRKFGISAGLIGEDKALDLKIEKGECCWGKTAFFGAEVRNIAKKSSLCQKSDHS